MKKTLNAAACAALLAVIFACAPVRAQLSSTVTTITHDSTFAYGRDYWFAMQSNYWGEDLGGKYMRIYITSAKNCIAVVQSGGNVTPVPVQPYHISSYKIPEFWEMESSGIVENKAIHVSCQTADIVVYDMSHNPYTSDGSFIIPTIGWGTDYVVAAYGSLYEGGGSYVFDLPSTMVVVADQDNTTVTLTPSCDCRQCTSGNDAGDANSTIVVYPQGVPVTFQLNRGQCVEMMPVKAQDADNYDMTGTLVHANQPIGVSGGSVCPNIPADRPYCDHVEDMIPPVRTWGETYYTSNPYNPDSNGVFGRYLFIASQGRQTIYRQRCGDSSTMECMIPNRYGFYWDELQGEQTFTSAAPFLVVEYINGSTYPDGINGLGDPAEAVVLAREQYTKAITFEAPQSVGNIVPYIHFVNVAVNVMDEKKTLFDGKSIGEFPKQCLDANWDMVRLDSIDQGAHTITGDDSGIGVWMYGYGYDESYAWSGPGQRRTFRSPDSVAPLATFKTTCFETYVHLSDSGTSASKLDMIRLDSVSNMSYVPDNNFIEGAGFDTSDYTTDVLDPTQPGILIISVFDLAGNHTTITTIYKSVVDNIEPPLLNVGIFTVGGTPLVAYDTLYNRGQDTFYITTLRLRYGNVGFSIYDSIGGPLDLSPLAPGQRRLIEIQFSPLKPVVEVDSILFGDECFTNSVTVIGRGGEADFSVSSQTWPNEPFSEPPTCYPKAVTISNLSNHPITIDSAWWGNTTNFQAVSTFPFTIPASPASVQFIIDYCPDTNSTITPDGTLGIWTSPQVLETDGKTESPRFDSLIGWSVLQEGVSETSSPSLEATILPSEDGRSLEIILPPGVVGLLHFELVNVLGESVQQATLGSGKQTLDESTLPRGVYFYHLNSGQKNQSGKIILGQ